MSYLKFDYYCKQCNAIWDVTVEQSILDTEKERELTRCPDCRLDTTRLIPAPMWKWASGSRGF